MAATEAFYTAVRPGPLGQRFCLWHADPTQAPRALLVHVHAFAEEMNKSRRMVALQSRGLADAGCAVFRMDLLGCGDSAGEFSDATWAAWLEDVASSVRLARERHAATWPGAAEPELWLWGLRAGALLAAEAAQAIVDPVNLLFWQPTPQGKQVLQQFLRLASAGALLGKGTGKAGARATLAEGKVAEVAGYGLAPALAAGLEAAVLQPSDRVGRMEWLDLAATGGQPSTPVAEAALKQWAENGSQVRHQTVVGPSFWQTTEIEEAPALLAATIDAVLQAPEPASAPAQGANSTAQRVTA